MIRGLKLGIQPLLFFLGTLALCDVSINGQERLGISI
jgi:hypothetical protein